MSTYATVSGRDIKSDNYRGIKAKTLGEKQQQVMDAALLAHAQGQRDFTNNELCVVMQGRLGRRVVPSDITSSIEALISSGLLAANYHHGRACSITGSTKVRTLFAVAKQAELGLAVKAPANAYGAAKARAAVDRRVAVIPQADAAPSSGMPPEVRARLAAIKAAATQGR